MSREAGRIRSQANAERLRCLLESRDRLELMGHAIARRDRLEAKPQGGAGIPPRRPDA
jgi:hypothetical protein